MPTPHASTIFEALAQTNAPEAAAVDTVSAAPSSALNAGATADDARQVAARLKLLLGAEGGFLAVAGVAADDGSTELARQLAIALSQIGSSDTLLIENDESGSPGLVDVLSRSLDLAGVVRPMGGNLYVLPYGSGSHTLASLLSSAQGSMALAALRVRFPYVIADVGAVLSNPNHLLLASRSDGVVAAVSAGVRRRHEVKHFHEQLQRLAVRLLGVVLTSGAARR